MGWKYGVFFVCNPWYYLGRMLAIRSSDQLFIYHREKTPRPKQRLNDGHHHLGFKRLASQSKYVQGCIFYHAPSPGSIRSLGSILRIISTPFQFLNICSPGDSQEQAASSQCKYGCLNPPRTLTRDSCHSDPEAAWQELSENLPGKDANIYCKQNCATLLCHFVSFVGKFQHAYTCTQTGINVIHTALGSYLCFTESYLAENESGPCICHLLQVVTGNLLSYYLKSGVKDNGK